MSLLNFSNSSANQLRGILGDNGNEVVGRKAKQSIPYIEARWFRVDEEVTLDDVTTYKASEVQLDGSDVTNGIIFDSEGTNTNKPDDPIYYKNLQLNADMFSGSVEVGKTYQVQAVHPKAYADPTKWYIIPQGGGGGVKYAIVVDEADLDYHYNVTLYNSRSSVGPPDPEDTVLLNMAIFNNYGTLPQGFVLPVSEIESDVYEPLDIQSTCFGVVIGLSDGQSEDHPRDNYDLTVRTSPYDSGFNLGTVTAKAPNVDYGVLGSGAKQTLQFVKENNAWYMNPATFGVY